MEYDPGCTRCHLHESAKKVCIPGRGSDRARVMFVGQAPGEDENTGGKCFTGPAGQLLTDAIRTYDLRPAFITNAAKCFPGKGPKGKGDKDPSPEALRECRPYLDEEIRRIAPEFIVTLGNIPLKLLVGKTGTKTWSGRIVGEYSHPGTFDENGYEVKSKVFSLLHPSYILRYPKDLPRFEADLRELSYLLRPADRPDGEAIWEATPAEFLSHLQLMGSTISFDYETNGKFKNQGGYIRTVAISDGRGAVWMNVEKHGAAAHAVIKEFLLMDVKKAAHNAPFEIRWSLDEYGIEPVRLVYDTFNLDHLIDENSAPHSLDTVASRLCEAPSWDIHPDMETNGWTWETVPIYPEGSFKGLGHYNAQDAFWGHRIIKPIMDQMTDPLKQLYREIQMPVAKVCGLLEQRGWHIDLEHCAKIDREMESEMAALEAKMKTHTPMRKLIASLEQRDKQLNINSDHHMRELFFDILGLPVMEETDGGKPSVKAEALEKVKGKSPLVQLYLDWKSRQTLRNNYLQKFPKFADDEHLIHSSINPAFVATGRQSATNPPSQAIPEEERVRGMLTSRWQKRGGLVTSADYKQLEVRLVASESGDETLMNAIATGQNLHELTARLIFGQRYRGKDKDHRLYSMAKRINFGIVYGISAYSLEIEFSISKQEAEGIMRKYEQAYPKVFDWMRIQHAKMKKYGFIENRFGRVRRLPDIKEAVARNDEKTIGRILRQTGNFPIASMGADINNLATVGVDRKIKEAGLRSMVVLPYHDAVIIDTYPGEQNQIREVCVQVMTVDVPARCPWLQVKLEVDIAQTERWGQTK